MSAPYPTFFPVRACINDASPITFTRERMFRVWEQMVAEGTQRWLFYDGQVRDALDYIEFMAAPNVYAYLVCDHDWETPLATYFVNGFLGRAGFMHFAYFAAGLSRRYQIGRETCTFLLNSGELSCLIGITPKPFTHAWKFATTVGFVHKAVLPSVCFLAYAKVPRLVDAVVTLCTPETLLPLPYK